MIRETMLRPSPMRIERQGLETLFEPVFQIPPAPETKPHAAAGGADRGSQSLRNGAASSNRAAAPHAEQKRSVAFMFPPQAQQFGVTPGEFSLCVIKQKVAMTAVHHDNIARGIEATAPEFPSGPFKGVARQSSRRNDRRAHRDLKAVGDGYQCLRTTCDLPLRDRNAQTRNTVSISV
jgi:hypothetical protein